MGGRRTGERNRKGSFSYFCTLAWQLLLLIKVLVPKREKPEIDSEKEQQQQKIT